MAASRRLTTTILILFFIAILFAPTAASAKTWQVPSEIPTISGAIGAAAAGDSIQIACGTYNEVVLIANKALTFRGNPSDPGCVVLDAQGASFQLACIAPTTIEGISFRNGYTNWDGGALQNSSDLVIRDCRFEDNHAGQHGGAIWSSNGSTATIERCVFEGNDSSYRFGAVAWYSNVAMTIDGCTFVGNSSVNFGGAIGRFAGAGAPVSITNSVFAANSAQNGGAIDLEGAGGTVSGCSFYGNTATLGAGSGGALYLWDVTLSFENNIVAFSTSGEGVAVASGSLAPTCCDLYGNADGDWVGSLAPYLGVDGNIASDPLFCDAAGGDFSLAGLSPCLFGGCGQIGALGLGCLDPAPEILSIEDVGHDQGGQLRVRWLRSVADSPLAIPHVTDYALYRRQDANKRGVAGAEAGKLAGWDYLLTVPATAEDVYQTIAPSLCDSTIADGMCWSVLMVRALTPETWTWWDSPPDSGYSLDNLAPGAPSSLVVAYGESNQLSWDESGDADFRYFKIYRGDSEDFVPAAGNLVHATAATLWTDPSGSFGQHYKLSAVDFAGNESIASAPELLTDRGEFQARFLLRLHPCVPNPFNPRTRIRFDLGRNAEVRLSIYDARGRLLRTLFAGELEAGEHAIPFDGRDAAGRRLSSGVYLASIVCEDQRQTARLVLLQ